MSTATETPILVMEGICKSYPGVRALKGVNLEVRPGEVHALVGENGAGKSTLMKILAGAERGDAGSITINGKPVTIDSPQRAMDLGVAIIYQEFNLVPQLSVAENIFLGREPRATLPGFVNFGAMRATASELMQRLGVSLDVRRPVSDVSVAQQQMIEIAKAISQKARVIAMDEPSATLTDHELRNLFVLIEQLRAQGVGIIYISHRLEEIFEIAERVTVFRDGEYIGTKEIGEVDRDSLIRMMVGRELTETFPQRQAEFGEEALRVEKLTRKGVLENINLSVRKGEIVGLAGLVGAGRSELARAIFGADPIDEGTLYLDGEKVRIGSPQEAIKRGIGLVTEDRKQLGLVLGMTIRENITLPSLKTLSRLGFVRRGREKQVSEQLSRDLSVKTPSIEQQVKNLSGGNQQKVVLAKWLFSQSRVLIFDEPTRGIDVGAKAEIYQLMNALAEKGAAIIMISSELPEVLGMSDRIMVMHQGRIAGEVPRAEATQERIMHLATGGE